MKRTGLRMEMEQDIQGVQYNKLLMNTMGYASVLSASDFITDGILCRTWRRTIARPLVAEGLAILQRACVQLRRTSGFSDVIRFRRLLRLLDMPLLDRTVKIVVNGLLRPKRIVYSVYQDLVRGKETEIDFVNGEIVRLAEEHGTTAPFNAQVVKMIRELEERGPGSFFLKGEVISRFRNL